MNSESSIFDSVATESVPKKKISTFGLVGIGVFGGLAVGIVAITLPFVSPGFRRVVLPYVPATRTQIDNVLDALRFKNPNLTRSGSSKLIDLGSGDGRIVIECAKHGIKSHGVELNPWLVMFSKYSAWRERASSLASFQRKNLFKVDLAEYDDIVIFGVDSLMPLIEKKVQEDCDRAKRGTSLVVCRFPFPNWEPLATFGSGVDQVWLYQYEPSQLNAQL